MSKKVNIVFFQPDIPSLLNIRGYEDVIDSVAFGMKLLGYEVHSTRNNYLTSGCQHYILFGWQIMSVDALKQFPVGTIVYNLEQYHAHINMSYNFLSENMKFVINNFQIFEYSKYNNIFWNQYNLRFPIFPAPIAFSENQIIPQSNRKQDIDILYYGSCDPSKAKFLQACAGSHLVRPKSIFIQNIYGDERNEFITRSKVVLSITGDRILPLVRIGFLLANKKPVISSIHPMDFIDDDLKHVLIFATDDNVDEKLNQLLSNDLFRSEYADFCHDTFRKRRIEDILRAFFE